MPVSLEIELGDEPVSQEEIEAAKKAALLTIVLKRYKQGDYSLGYAAERLRMAPADFLELAGRTGIPLWRDLPVEYFSGVEIAK